MTHSQTGGICLTCTSCSVSASRDVISWWWNSTKCDPALCILAYSAIHTFWTSENECLDTSNMSVQEEHVEEIKNRNVFDIIATRPQQGIQIEESLDVSDTISDINTHEGVQAVENRDSSDTEIRLQMYL